jgi:pimeloyl-ACP methyl ester carboxylesterase
MKLRLYHHHDGARVAYREAGTGPPLALLHSPGLSHREFAPVADELAERYRLVLPDLPGHGDSEDRPRHPWTPEWLAEVIAGFCGEVLGPRPLVGGHDVGAELLLRAAAAGWLRPRKVVLMSSRLHTEMPRGHKIRTWRAVTRAAVVPGLDRALAGVAPAVFRPAVGIRLSARGNPEAANLVRHAFKDVSGNSNRARSWAKLARNWPMGVQLDLLDAYERLAVPVLLLWADEDRLYPVSLAEDVLARLPNGQLRVLDGAGYLMAYDDPVGVVRELVAFCR